MFENAKSMRGFPCLLCPTFLCFCIATGSLSQAPSPAMPDDPKQLMMLASKVNGLMGEDVKPWHLTATYKLLDEKGNTTDQGTYEEFWVNPTRFKRTYTGTTFTQTDYGTEKGILRSGQRQPVPILVSDMRRDFIEPLLSPEAVENSSFTLQHIDSKGIKLVCLRRMNLADSGMVPCLIPDRPILFINVYSPESIQAIHGRILGFHDRFISGDLNFVRGGKSLLVARVVDLRSLNPVNDGDFLPPPDATLLPRRVNMSGDVAAAMMIKHDRPDYPPIARAANVSGTVVLKAVIGTDGHISDLQAISGPPMLLEAALEAVRKWTYHPYLLNGEPVEVDTTINVVFSLASLPPGIQ
jgi:TonB family protein